MKGKAFDDFYRFMRPKLFRYARRKVDEETAHEVALDAMTTIWLKRVRSPRTEGELAQLQSLAYRVAEGHMRNALRGERRRTSVRDALEQQLHVAARQENNPQEALMAADIYTAISGLAQPDRDVLSLHIDGYPTGEIALILNCSPKAASMRLARARKRLESKLEGVKDEP